MCNGASCNILQYVTACGLLKKHTQIHIHVYPNVFDFALCINLYIMLLGSCVKMLCE
jgi:hypothetical protein